VLDVDADFREARFLHVHQGLRQLGVGADVSSEVRQDAPGPQRPKLVVHLRSHLHVQYRHTV